MGETGVYTGAMQLQQLGMGMILSFDGPMIPFRGLHSCVVCFWDCGCTFLGVPLGHGVK